METPAYEALVHRLERVAARTPRAYRARVTALALLGYVYLLGMLLVLLGLTVGLALTAQLLALKLIIPLLIVIVAVVRALWVRVPPPQGMTLSETEVPALFDLVRQLERRLRAPRVHAILAVPQLNAAVVQQPRLGVLGWYRNYLVAGLPLMQTLSAQEWQSVLAHELGHLSGRHGRFGAWIYRQRETWSRLLGTLAAKRSRIGRLAFSGFLKWYAPYFNAYSFVLARAHEYEADRASADLVGEATACRALLRLEVATRLSDGFWSNMDRSNADAPEPPRDPFRQLRAALQSGARTTEATEWVGKAWARPTTYADTHPALSDRLRALGWAGGTTEIPTPPAPLAEASAASVYLGAAEAKVELEYDQMWVRQVFDRWTARHAKLVTVRERLRQLETRPAEALTPDEEWQRLSAYVELGDLDRVGALAEALLARQPDHAGARFHVGQALLRRGDRRGAEEIEAVMRQDPNALIPGCQLLSEFFSSVGDMAQADRYRRMGEQRAWLLREAQAERATMTDRAELQPHDWPAEQVAALVEQLRKFPALREAYLARRVVRVLPEIPCYILGIRPRYRWWMGDDPRKSAQLRQTIARQVVSPHPYYVFVLVGPLKSVRRRLARMPSTQVI
jgi:Zn-dependent protease with chaperone function